MNDSFDDWNTQAKKIQQKERLYFKEREIWWASIGKNIGWEEDGKGEDFLRPVVIIKKHRKELFLAVPLTTTIRNNKIYFFDLSLKGKDQQAILSQVRTLDSLRLVRKKGVLDKETFEKLKKVIRKLLY
jgi:mRNA interferase MazF